MRTVCALVLSIFACLLPLTSGASSSPRVIDDEGYSDKVTRACRVLMKHRKLVRAETLKNQVRTKGFPVTFQAESRERLSTPELYDRLCESTFCVGSFYKCPDCGDWHFNSSVGFAVAENGIISTCSHVITAEDKDVKESYLVAADISGQVFPILKVLAADTEADTCLVKIEASRLKPLPFRSAVRAGEHVFCLGNPGGYYFMFSDGIVARLNLRRDPAVDNSGKTNGFLTRPLLYVNTTAEFAPGSSGGPVVDECANVVAQVSSIAEAGDPDKGDDEIGPSPSVPIRFCISAQEIMRLSDADLEKKVLARKSEAIPLRSSHMISTNHPPRTPSR
jgi:S1-C subfamily serine protease